MTNDVKLPTIGNPFLEMDSALLEMSSWCLPFEDPNQLDGRKSSCTLRSYGADCVFCMFFWNNNEFLESAFLLLMVMMIKRTSSLLRAPPKDCGPISILDLTIDGPTL